MRDVQLFVSEIRRVLTPGGRLALTTPAARPLMRPPDPLSPHLRAFTPRSLRRLLDELGFEIRVAAAALGDAAAVAPARADCC